MIIPYGETPENNTLKTLSKDTPEDVNEMLIDEYDKAFLKYLAEMHWLLGKERIDLTKVVNVLDALEKVKKMSEHEYLSTLLRPEKTRGSKLPSQIPIPSSSFQLKQTITLRTNASGNVAFIFNPFHLENIVDGNSTLYVNNSATLSGNSLDNNFLPVNLGQGIPPVYSKYRLVSGSVVVRYVGRLDIVQGMVGGCAMYDTIPKGNVLAGVPLANAAKYGDFNLARDAYFQQEHFTLDGIRMLYFPFDNSFEEYYSLGSEKTGFCQFFYAQSCPANSECFKLDVFLNFECLAEVQFLNYIPTTLCSSTYQNNKLAISEVQRKPIMKAEEINNYVGNFKNALVDKVKGYLPKMNQVVDWLGKAYNYASPFVSSMLA